MMKKIFATPKIEVTSLFYEDVVCTSADVDILRPGTDIAENEGELE